MSSISNIFTGLAGFFRRALGVSKRKSAVIEGKVAAVDLVASIIESPVVLLAGGRMPEVAGYERRLPVVDFMLAGRLASVATLNSKSGRKPRVQNSMRAGAPIMPVARMGAKKQRSSTVGPRVTRPVPIRRSADIFVFPTGEALAAAQSGRTAKAA